MKSIYLLTRNTINSRWMVIPAGFFIMSVSGAIYAFGVYSGAIKTALDYNQKTLTTIGFFKDFGNIGIFAGIIADLFPAWVVLSIGVAFNTCGYLMIWLAVTKRIAKPALWQMYLYITIGGNSVSFTHAGALVTCVKNFPLHRGMIVGLLKGFLGLSTAILTLIYRAIYGDHPSSFILLITYLPLAVIFVFMFFIRPIPLPSDEGRIEDEAKVFYRLLWFEVSVAAYLMVVILIQHEVGVKKVVNGVFAGALAIMMFVPVGLVAWMEYQKLRTNRTAADVETNVKQLGGGEEVNNGLAKVQPKDSPDESTEEEEELVKETNTENNPKKSLVRRLRDALRTPAVGQDFTVWQALVHPYFWILSAASTGGLGAGLMLIDNLGQVGAAYGYDREKTGTFVSLISIWNCLGRVGVGFLSEFFLQKYGLARPFFFAVALALSALGYLAIGLNWPGALFFGSILIGLCFGAQWSLLHIIVSEIFGLKYYGTLQSIIAMASPLGTYLLSVRVAGYMYDKEADRQRASGHISGQNVACHGTVCYKKSLLIMCGVCTAGCLLTLVMTWHTQRFYKREVYERLKAKRIEMVKAKQEAARLNGK